MCWLEGHVLTSWPRNVLAYLHKFCLKFCSKKVVLSLMLNLWVGDRGNWTERSCKFVPGKKHIPLWVFWSSEIYFRNFLERFSIAQGAFFTRNIFICCVYVRNICGIRILCDTSRSLIDRRVVLVGGSFFPLTIWLLGMVFVIWPYRMISVLMFA